MHQEFLRDVLRTGDASGRARRRLAVLPVSIAAHAAAVTIFVLAPFVDSGELPVIASPLPDYIRAMPTPPSPPPAARPPDPAPSSRSAPTEAPTAITPEVPRASSDPGVDGGVTTPGVESG